jgi:hypothetical protein
MAALVIMSGAINFVSAKGAAAVVLVSPSDISAMREAIKQPGSFQDTFKQQQAEVEKFLAEPMAVPIPADAGGGYTHEQHKLNAQHMYLASTLYLLTKDERYAAYTRDMLKLYGAMYPSLPRHPKRTSSNEGKLFWQGLNEAVWLVHTIQAYDMIAGSLGQADKSVIENGVLRPMAMFLSKESPHTFNKVHNHGTWANAAVGMTGYVLGEPDWVEWSLYDLDKSGKGGFLRQLDTLFSPDGYYTEGPYYQRYALMPFVIFAKAIALNDPQRHIFEYRDGILLKAITTTIELSYNGLFFPLNDAIKSKGIDTSELVYGVALAYRLTANPEFLDIAQQQHNILLTADGLKVSQGLDQQLMKAYEFPSKAYLDGGKGDEGALVVMREATVDKPAIVFKATSQGMGHGHFDKLTWQFYDKGAEIVTDYGAARFLNVVTKEGGRYLPENTSYAKQTLAHNTLVVDETSHFNGNVKVASQYHPTILLDIHQPNMKVSAAEISTAYEDTKIVRVLAMVSTQDGRSFVIDKVTGTSPNKHTFDLPLHYNGQITFTSMPMETSTTTLSALGTKNGYQHLWLRAVGTLDAKVNQVTWLNENGKFYTLSLAAKGGELLFTQLGAGDPNFNLRSEKALIRRTQGKQASYLSVLEPHGEYDPGREFTAGSLPTINNIDEGVSDGFNWVRLSFKDGTQHTLIYRLKGSSQSHSLVTIGTQTYEITGNAAFF